MDELKEKWIQMLSDLAEVTSKFNELARQYPDFLILAQDVINRCNGVLATLNNNDYTVDGGSPFQQVLDGEFDCNGGYPGI